MNLSAELPQYFRTVKSFVLREGRVTKSQQFAIDNYWQFYGISIRQDIKLNFEEIFKNKNPITLEIGFGNGDSLLAMAKSNPNINFVGVEVYKSGVGKILHDIHVNEIGNLKIIWHDASEIINHNIADNSLDNVQVFFPDPWPKKRHHKRRIINDRFVELLSKKLKDNGILHLATDWENYAEWMQDVLASNPKYKKTTAPFAPELLVNKRPNTRFEQKGIVKGHGIWDLYYKI